MKRAPSIPVRLLVPTPPHTHKRLSKYAALNKVSFITTGLECGTGVPAHMLPTLGPFPSSFRRRLSEPERTHSTLTHTHYTRRLTHLHSECARVTDKSVELSVLLRRGFKVQVQVSRVQIPQPMNSSESDRLPTPHFPLQTQGLWSQVARSDDARCPPSFTAAPQPKRLRSPPRPLPGAIESVAVARRLPSSPARTDAL